MQKYSSLGCAVRIMNRVAKHKCSFSNQGHSLEDDLFAFRPEPVIIKCQLTPYSTHTSSST